MATERFEMRLEQHLLQKIDEWRSAQTDVPTRTEAMRRLLESGLATNEPKQIRFSDGEKLISVMLGDIYKHLNVKGDVDAELVSKVVTGGHYWALKWELQGTFPDHMDNPEDVNFVVDVLDMWSFIESAFKAMSTKEKSELEKMAIRGKNPLFVGFDGNNESHFYSICRFIIEDLNRFSEFSGRDFNSHHQTVLRYRKMLAKFLPTRANVIGRELSMQEMIEILNV